MKPAWRLGSAALALACLAGCSDYVSSYRYYPRPMMAYVRSTSTTAPSPSVSVLASVIGIRRSDNKLGIPTSVEIHFRIDNAGPESATLDPRTMQLIDGSLLNFPPPVVRPGQPVNLAPSQSAVLTAYFPFPPGRSYDETNMENLQLRWTLQVGSQPLHQAVVFYRAYPLYY